jgi:tetratricopeptide (TPR) repeat protein
MGLVEQGKELAQNGKYAEALELFKKALENDRRNPDLLFYIGTCYSSLGDFAVAKHFYQQVLKIDPNHSRTKKVWDGLEEVEARPPHDSKDPPASPEDPAAGLSEAVSEQLADTTREPRDKWAEAFPDTLIQSPGRRGGLGIWAWVLVALVVAALVYFIAGPRFLR